MSVTLIDESLSKGDLVVVNSARVSFAKAHDFIDHDRDPKLIRYLAQHDHWSPFGHAQIAFRMTLTPQQCEALLDAGPAGMRLSVAEEPKFDTHRHLVSGSIYAFMRLLPRFNYHQQQVIKTGIERRYPLSFEELHSPAQSSPGTGLAEGGYAISDVDLVELALEQGLGDKVVRHATATVHIKAPIYVARQLVKHQVDLVWNEISRRYVDLPLTFAEQPEWSVRPENKKQGAGGPAIGEALDTAMRLYDEVNSGSHAAYDRLVRLGIAPEQARSIQTLASETEWYWTGTLDAFARVCRLRLHKDAQKETAAIAEGIEAAMWEQWGEVWNYAY